MSILQTCRSLTRSPLHAFNSDDFKEQKTLTMNQLWLSSAYMTKLTASIGNGLLIGGFIVNGNTHPVYQSIQSWMHAFATGQQYTIDKSSLKEFMLSVFDTTFLEATVPRKVKSHFYKQYQLLAQITIETTKRYADNHKSWEKSTSSNAIVIDFSYLRNVLRDDLSFSEFVSKHWFNHWILKCSTLPNSLSSAVDNCIDEIRVYPAFMVLKIAEQKQNLRIDIQDKIIFKDDANCYDKVYVYEFALCELIQSVIPFARGAMINHIQASKLYPDQYQIHRVVLRRII